jgi:hypothetical protein
MSTLGTFYAIPPESIFYHELETNSSLIKIAKHLFGFGSGIYTTFEIESELMEFTGNLLGTKEQAFKLLSKKKER